MSSNGAFLELEDVEARYGPIKALHGVSLRVGEGEMVAILGANGAGKTTTLRAVSGTVRKSGDVRFAGRSISRRSPERIARLGIAHVPEGRGLFAELSVWDNLRMGAYIRGERKTIKQEAERVATYFPWLERRKSQQAGTLSGGEQQMLALGRALMARPRLLMLDEPSQGIMPKLVDEIFQAVKRIRDAGMTVLIVEQRMAECLEIADRAYILQTGRVLMQGSAADIRVNPDVRKAYLGL